MDPLPFDVAASVRSPQEPGSPQWWRDRLGARLSARQAAMERLQGYYEGRHPLAFAGEKFREAFGGLFRSWSDNFTPLIVEACLERLTVTGFRLSKEVDGKTGSAPADDAAWSLWQRNGMDAASELLHQEALVKSEASVLVWYAEGTTDKAHLTIEDPMQMIVDHDPADRRKRRAALKRWVDDDGYLYATLYLPDAIYKWRSESKYSAGTTNVNWKVRQPKGESWPMRNPLNRVPVVPFYNRPRLTARDGMFGLSEIASVLPIQDAINKLVADMLVASEFAAYRQRYALNFDLETDPATGQPRVPFKIGADRMLAFPSPDPENPHALETKVGEFSVTDLTPYIKAIETLVQHVATQTRTPAHYLLGQTGSFPSGESLKSTETGLVAKTRQKMRHFSDPWEEVVSLGFLVEGDDDRAAIDDGETLWEDPESRTESEHVDAVVKMGGDPIRIPQEALWEDLGKTPQQIARYRLMSQRQAMTAAAASSPFASMPQMVPEGTSPAAAPPLEGTAPSQAQPQAATNGNGRTAPPRG